MKKELKNIITESSFTVNKGRFVYAKVKTQPLSADHFFVAHDADEITVVTQKEKLDELDLVERNADDYALIALNVSIPFYSVGFLAAITSAIADQNLNALVVSTYSKDYLMVRFDLLPQAKDVLLVLGMHESQ